jgi:hypothetical protein
MKKYAAMAATLAIVAALSFASTIQAAPKTYEGTLVDSKCYLAHGEMGNDHMGMKDCGTTCLRGGNPAGLVTSMKEFHTIVAPSIALAPYVGQTIRVTGEEKSGAIVADKVEVKKGDMWEEIKLSGMM